MDQTIIQILNEMPVEYALMAVIFLLIWTRDKYVAKSLDEIHRRLDHINNRITINEIKKERN